MINPHQLQQIKMLIENQSESGMSAAIDEIQRVVYSLGGTRDITKMSPGATALYLTILLELNRSLVWHFHSR